MGTFQIEGGHQLKGDIQPQGAKNEALQILCAVLLTPERVIINNIPDIVDVNKLITILSNLGVKIQKLGKGKYSFKSDALNLDYLEGEQFKKEGALIFGHIIFLSKFCTVCRAAGAKILKTRFLTNDFSIENSHCMVRRRREIFENKVLH